MSKIITYQEIKEYIQGSEGNGCKLLMTEEELQQAKLEQNKSITVVKLKILCGQCDKEIFYTSFNKFKNRNKRQCNNCGIFNTNKNRRVDGQIVFNKFKEVGLEPLFKPEEYTNCSQQLPCICKKHEDKGIQYKIYDKIRIGRGCKWCGIEKQSGENNCNWKGGISNLHEHLRSTIGCWKIDSFKHQNFKCLITKKNSSLIVHHIHNFSDIVEEVMSKLGLPVKNKINEYNKKDLELIENQCIVLHYKYGYGVVLNSNLHDLFHSKELYGNRNNTKEQFKEFITRLESGEFSDFLKENNLELNINYEVLNQLLN